MYQTARPYDPYLIPLPIRMGRVGSKEIPPGALHNTELLKVSLTIEGLSRAVPLFVIIMITYGSQVSK